MTDHKPSEIKRIRPWERISLEELAKRELQKLEQLSKIIDKIYKDKNHETN
jgi:hypothetical protein